MKKLMIAAFVLLFVGTTTFAQGQKGQKKHKVNPELKSEMRAYIEQKMYPGIKDAHVAFEGQLSQKDLTFLQNKRSDMELRKAEIQQKRAKMKESGATKEEIQEKMKAAKEANADKRKAEKEEMKAFMERNKIALDNTIGALKPNYETWIADQKSIIEKYRPAGTVKPQIEGDKQRKPKIGLFGLATPRNRGHRGGGQIKEGKGDMGNQPVEKKDKKKGKYKAGQKIALEFVLWNGDLPPVKEEKIRKK